MCLIAVENSVTQHSPPIVPTKFVDFLRHNSYDLQIIKIYAMRIYPTIGIRDAIKSAP